MDIFYYWKDYDADMKAGRIGRFRTNRNKLGELAEAGPDDIWIFRTPKGRKGDVQLIARVRWADKTTRPFAPEPDQSYIHYNPEHPESVRFADSNAESAIAAMTRWVKVHFPAMRTGNFQGELGQQALRGSALFELRALSKGLATAPFIEAAE